MSSRACLAGALACLLLAPATHAGWFERFQARRDPPPPTPTNAVPPVAVVPVSPERVLYDEIVAALVQHYADPTLISSPRLAQTALRGLLASLDPSVRLLDKTNASPPRADSSPLGAITVLDPWIGHARLARVVPDSGRLLRAEVERQRKDEHIQGFILDLRFASGTAWAEVPALAAAFVPGGRVVMSVARGSATEPFETPSGNAPTLIPLVVLVNHATSGAAEALAAVLQDQRRAVVLGNASTAGDAFETVDVPLANGQILRFATGKFILPGSGPFFLRGVKPDVAVALDPKLEQSLFAEPFRAPDPPRDPRYYSEAILTGRDLAPPIRDPKTPKPKNAPASNRDLVLLQAMDLLKSLNALNLDPPASPTGTP
ncbi:MAG: S41 family peptidase [Verrucomicrobiia bacterium]